MKPTDDELCEQIQERKAAEAKLKHAVEVLRKFEAHYPMGINPMLDEAAIAACAVIRDMDATP